MGQGPTRFQRTASVALATLLVGTALAWVRTSSSTASRAVGEAAPTAPGYHREPAMRSVGGGPTLAELVGQKLMVAMALR